MSRACALSQLAADEGGHRAADPAKVAAYDALFGRDGDGA